MIKEKNFKIGVVDDNIHIVLSISQMLEHWGFRVFKTYNGKEAIEKSKKEMPDILIVDIRMPGISGFDVAKKLPNQKILFITGYDFDNKEISEFRNVIGVLQKPIDMGDLLERLRKELDV